MSLQLIVFSGLPGAGKTSVAEAVARELQIPVFAKDWLEGSLLQAGMKFNADSSPSLGYFGYELLTTLALQQLRLSQSVILDSVASTATIRDTWRALAAEHNARWRVIECICSDETIHRGRLVTRQRGIRGWHELTWGEIERVKSYYAPWDEERLVLDMVDPLENNIQTALAYLRDE